MIIFIIMYTEFDQLVPDQPSSSQPGNLMVMDEDTHRWLHEKSDATRRAYLHDLLRVNAMLDKSLREITADDIAFLRDSLKELALPTQRRTMATINSYLKHRAQSGSGLPLASHRLELPKVTSRPNRIPTRTDIERLFACETDPRNRLLLQVLYEAAPRGSEIPRLRWRDVQGDALTGAIMLREVKTREGRRMPLSSKVWQALLELRGDAGEDEPIFRSQKGGPLTTTQIFRIVQEAGRRAKLPSLSPQTLRHTHITHALQAGASMSLIQKQLGYKSVEILARYLPPAADQSTLSFLSKEVARRVC